jgi:hypothetical protein
MERIRLIRKKKRNEEKKQEIDNELKNIENIMRTRRQSKFQDPMRIQQKIQDVLELKRSNDELVNSVRR